MVQQINKYKIQELGVENTNILTTEDSVLVNSYTLGSVPFLSNKYVLDLSIYDLSSNYIETIKDIQSYRVNTSDSTGGSSEISVNPVQDSLDRGYLGDVVLKYEVYNNLLSTSRVLDNNSVLIVTDISTDRTEVRTRALNLSNLTVKNYVDSLYNRLNNETYFSEIYLDFSDLNIKAVGINVMSEVLNGIQYVIFKLYEPLPTNVTSKARFFVTERVGEPVLFQVNREVEVVPDKGQILRGPNFNVPVGKETRYTSEYRSYGDIQGYPVSSSREEIYASRGENNASIAIDYNNFEDFIHFSSAKERLDNFRYKLQILQDCEASMSILPSGDPAKKRYSTLYTNIISNFDHYDRYLYFSSGSKAWPKVNGEKPYINVAASETLSPGGSISSWWNSMLEEALAYDSQNDNILINSIPKNIREDSNNEPYLMFVHMVGQFFDNEWIYAKALTDRYNADNRLDFGISKDLVRDALTEFGLNLKESNQSLDGEFSRLGIDGSFDAGEEIGISVFEKIVLGRPIYIDPATNVHDGKEANSTFVTGSNNLDGEYASRLSGSVDRVFDGEDAKVTQKVPYSSNQIDDVDTYRKEVYKRLYHNLPFLIKTKGTNRCLRALFACFGIPEEILNISLQKGVRKDSDVNRFGPDYIQSSTPVRLDNTGSFVPFAFEGGFVDVPVLSGLADATNIKNNYTESSRELSIGFNINKQANNYIAASSSGAYNFNDIVGDPRNRAENYGTAFTVYYEDIFGDKTADRFRTPSAIVRLTRYFDSALFRTLADFLPANVVCSTGLVVEDNILHRNRYKGITIDRNFNTKVTEYSGSTGKIELIQPLSVDGSTGTVESVSGSDGGTLVSLQDWSKYMIYTGSSPEESSSFTVNYEKKYTVPTHVGTKSVDGCLPKYDGEFNGTELIVSDGTLINNNFYRSEFVRGNPYMHAGADTKQYSLRVMFLTLPAPSDYLLVLVGSSFYKLITVYSKQLSGTVFWNHSSEDTIDGLGAVTGSSIELIYDGGNSSTSSTNVLEGGESLPVRDLASDYQLSGGEGYLPVLTGSFAQIVLRAEPSKTSTSYFLGWYKGNVTGSISPEWNSFLSPSLTYTLHVTEDMDREYTARFYEGRLTSMLSGITFNKVDDSHVRISNVNLGPASKVTLIVRTKTTDTNRGGVYFVDMTGSSETHSVNLYKKTVEGIGVQSVIVDNKFIDRTFGINYFCRGGVCYKINWN